jgi:hypothetical protein
MVKWSPFGLAEPHSSDLVADHELLRARVQQAMIDSEIARSAALEGVRRSRELANERHRFPPLPIGFLSSSPEPSAAHFAEVAGVMPKPVSHLARSIPLAP